MKTVMIQSEPLKIYKVPLQNFSVVLCFVDKVTPIKSTHSKTLKTDEKGTGSKMNRLINVLKIHTL